MCERCALPSSLYGNLTHFYPDSPYIKLALRTNLHTCLVTCIPVMRKTNEKSMKPGRYPIPDVLNLK